MRDCHNQNHTRRLRRKMFDIRSSENSSKQAKNFMNGLKFGDEEVDLDYAWLLGFLTNTNDHTNVIKDKDHVEDENKNEDEDEDEDEDENDKDPQYCRFLKELTENGKSYKLKISRNGETPFFLEYEEPDKTDEHEPPSDTNISFGNNGDNVNSSEDTVPMQIDQRAKSSRLVENEKILTTKEVARKKKINVHKSITEAHCITTGSCYQLLLDGCVSSEYGAFDYEGKHVRYEENATSSDSDILIWENVKDCNEVNNEQLAPAKKDLSLKDKLLQILRKPYDQKEYEELLEYAEQEKPICRLLPLRRRSISSALDGATKSVVDDVPDFRRKLKAARNERHKALNLLRMFRFWLEHLPNKDSFKPWVDEDCLKVLPSTTTR